MAMPRKPRRGARHARAIRRGIKRARVARENARARHSVASVAEYARVVADASWLKRHHGNRTRWWVDHDTRHCPACRRFATFQHSNNPR